MSRLMRQELEELNKGGPVARFFNHPLVLVAMLAACIGLIVYGLNRKRPDPERPLTTRTGGCRSGRDWKCCICCAGCLPEGTRGGLYGSAFGSATTKL